jgi:hypothetical protein
MQNPPHSGFMDAPTLSNVELGAIGAPTLQGHQALVCDTELCLTPSFLLPFADSCQKFTIRLKKIIKI